MAASQQSDGGCPAADAAAMSSAMCSEASEDDCCAICLEAGPQVHLHMLMSCSHSFCEPCIGKFAIRKSMREPVRCPLCRAEIGSEDLRAIKLPLVLSKSKSNSPLGLELTFNENDDDKPTILRVAPGSPAEAAGLRTAQRVLSMEDVSLHGQPAALEVLANIRQSEEAGFVKLTIGDIRPERSQVHQVIRGQRGSSHDPYVNENCCAATLCYCTLLGQLWQHVMKGPRASCVIIAIALWLLFLLGLLLAVVAINHVQRDQGSHANLCRNRQQCSGGINLAPPAPPSAPMPVETRLQVPIPLLAAAYALIFWCASSLLLVRIRDVLRKESAQEWRPAMVQKAEDAEASKINRDPNRSPRRSNDPSRPIHGRRCAWLRRRWLRLPPRPFIGCYSVGERLEEASGCYGFSLLGPFLCGFGLAGRILFFLRVPQDSYRFCAPLDSVAGPLAPRPAYAV